MEVKKIPDELKQAEAFKRYIARELGCTIEEVTKWQKQKQTTPPTQNPTA